MRLILLLSLVTITYAEYSIRDFDEWSFRAKLEKALEKVKSILDTTRNPRLLESEENHVWADKYDMVEHITSVAISAETEALIRMLELNADHLQTFKDWVHQGNNTVVLQFESQDSCSFLGEEEVSAAGGVEYETIEESDGRKAKSRTTKVLSKHTEYHWQANMAYQIKACPSGNLSDSRAVELMSREGSAMLRTRSSKAPFAEKSGYDPLELDITWLIKRLAPETFVASFIINRESESCKTPTRNMEVEAAVAFHELLSRWTYAVIRRIELQSSTISTSLPSRDDFLTSIRTDSIFVPMLPLVENGTVCDAATTTTLLQHHTQTLDHAMKSLSSSFQNKEHTNGFLSSNKALLILLGRHLGDLSREYRHTVAYLEHALSKQLEKAIGKELTASDFIEFMKFYSQKFFSPDFAPVPFSHAIRRPGRYPDGVLSIEDRAGLIATLVRTIPGTNSVPARIPIDAATEVLITGNKFLHGWLDHRFGSFQVAQPKLIARARQFSSFLLIVGKMAGPDLFEPKHAIILQNKDEILIPLLSDVLPSAKEFKDAIASLSSEQQEFARAFRQMQLETSIFAVCIVQLKPQIETVLGLRVGALTKEIQLTQDLLSLFVDYQIPPDLLSYDGDSTAGVEGQVAAVKTHVEGVMAVIDGLKKKHIQDEAEKADIRGEMRYTATTGFATMGWEGEVASAFSNPLDEEFFHDSLDDSSRLHSSGRLQQRRLRAANFESMRGPRQEDLPPEPHPGDQKGDRKSESETYEFSEGPKTTTGSKFQGKTMVDFTLIPTLLDAQLEQHDTDGALRSTIITAQSQDWVLVRQPNLLSEAVRTLLSSEEVATEHKKAMDLLDAISRSGSLPLEAAELHVIVGVAHSFEKNMIETLVQDNINPIEKVERSMVMLASAIYGESVGNLLADDAAQKRWGPISLS